ncbi:MAG: LysR family transcriptional regulator [Methylorubrum populi]
MAFDGRVISNVSVLAAIVEAGSFSRAGEALGMSRSGVSRAVGRLEARLGVQLLDRTTRVVALTDEGRRFYSNVAPLLIGIDEAVTATSDAAVSVRGRLRVNVDAFFSSLLLAPIIGDFLNDHPELTLDIVARDHLGDLISDCFDVAVRFGTPPDSSLIARKLLETRTITVASPSYLSRCERPSTPNDLPNHSCIQVRDSLTGQPIEYWQFTRGKDVERVSVPGRLMVADFGTMIGACVSGVGIARVKAIGVSSLIERGALVELLPNWLGESFSLFALYTPRNLPPAKVAAFVKFLIKRAGKTEVHKT